MVYLCWFVSVLVCWLLGIEYRQAPRPARAKRIIYLPVIDSLSSVMLEACKTGDDQRVSVEPIMLAHLSMYPYLNLELQNNDYKF